MKVLLVGGKKKVRFLAQSFLDKHFKVSVINKDLNFCKQIAEEFEKVVVINGDGTKPYVLEDAQAGEMDMVIAMAPTDAENLVICELCKKMFQVPRTVAVVNNPQNMEIFTKLGVDSAVNSISLIASVIEERAISKEVESFLPIEGGKVAVLEVTVDKDSPIAGKTLEEAGMPEDSVISCILRNNQPIIPNGTTKIEVFDKLIVVTYHQHHEDVLQAIVGKVHKS